MQESCSEFSSEDALALVNLVDSGELSVAELVEQLFPGRVRQQQLLGRHVEKGRLYRWLELRRRVLRQKQQQQQQPSSPRESTSMESGDEGVLADDESELMPDLDWNEGGSGGGCGSEEDLEALDRNLRALLEVARERRLRHVRRLRQVRDRAGELLGGVREQLRPALESLQTDVLEALTQLAGDLADLQAVRDELFRRRDEHIRRLLHEAEDRLCTLQQELESALQEDDGEAAAESMLAMSNVLREVEEGVGLSPGDLAKIRRQALERYRQWVRRKCSEY
eukprot:ctg_2206.g433